MKTLALLNQKGGCGKTTTAVNLAGALAVKGERVLLVDLDPQAHATLALSVALESGETSLADVMIRGTPIRDALRAAPGGITLLPATLELGELEEMSLRVLNPEQILRRGLAQLADAFDFVIVDCPPRADGVLTANALRAADVAILVVETGAFALRGALTARSIVEELAVDLRADFELRVVGTLFDRRLRLAQELLVAMQARFGALMFDTVIHQSVRLREAAACGVPVQLLDPRCHAARNFESLAEEIRSLAQNPLTARRRRLASSRAVPVPIQSR